MNPKDEIKEKLSIIDVISTYVRLEKAGSQYRARCPFHNERTPSFYVSPERKNFHCFGCGAHGDIFTFVEKLENIPFYDALKMLADRAGIALTPNKDSQAESRLISLLKDTTEYFEVNFQKSAEAKEYIGGRGVLDDTRAHFHIGYANNEWRTLFAHLMQKGYQPEEMEQAGVVIKALDEQGNTKGWYDRFRGRVMFPIRNIAGATVGYSGRILPSLLDPTKELAKYVNTPETPLYHKSKILFGYDTAKKMMNEKKEVVVVEGQMDLVMSYQAGVYNTIAVSGTAFTDEHINLIKRFCNKVILSFDTDNAGQVALRKSALMCLYGGLDVYVVGDIGTKDPADLIKENNEAWITALEKRTHVIEYLLGHIMKETQDAREQGKRIVTELLPFIRAIQSSIDKMYFVKIVANKVGIPEEILVEEMKRGSQISSREDKQEESVSPQKQKISIKEKQERELIAFVTWKHMKDHELVMPLSLPYEEYPPQIIEEHIFELEKTTQGDADKVLRDLVNSYKKELYRVKLTLLQERMRKEGDDHETILKQIYELTKEFHS